LTVQLANEFGH